MIKQAVILELLPGFGPGTSSLPRGEGEGLDDGIPSFLPLRVLKKVLNCFVEDLRKIYAKILRTAEAVSCRSLPMSFV